MKFPDLSSMLKGSNGQYEATRSLGALGVLSYIVCGNAFMAWNMARGHEFDIVAYCAAFPGGLGIAVAAIAGSAAWKDKGVASAKVIESTGSQPGVGSAQPQEVVVTNSESDPVPTVESQ